MSIIGQEKLDTSKGLLYEDEYEMLFPDAESKANAFDKIAKLYYMNNFGSASKTDIDLLMFSMYLDRIYSMEEVEEKDFSDYRLSRILGITQQRINSLKERKELKYPSQFDWKNAFLKVLPKAELSGGKVYIFINDQRLYVELCNAVRELGSYSETTLTRQQFVVSPAVLVDLMVEVCPNDEKEQLRDSLISILRENHIDADKYLAKRMTFREVLKDNSAQIVDSILLSATQQIPIVGPALEPFVGSILKSINTYIETKNKAKF